MRVEEELAPGEVHMPEEVHILEASEEAFTEVCDTFMSPSKGVDVDNVGVEDVSAGNANITDVGVSAFTLADGPLMVPVACDSRPIPVQEVLSGAGQGPYEREVAASPNPSGGKVAGRPRASGGRLTGRPKLGERGAR